MKPRTESTERKYYEPSNTTLVVLGIVAALLLVLYIFTLTTVVRAPREEQVDLPGTVASLLDDMFVKRRVLDDVADEYFKVLPVSPDLAETEEDSAGITTTNEFLVQRPRIALDYLLGEDIGKVHGYEVAVSHTGYVEVIMLDIADQPIYPRFALFYKLDGEAGDAIVDYSMGRLQPYSRRHEEYNKTWKT